MSDNVYFRTFGRIFGLLHVFGVFPFRFTSNGGVITKRMSLAGSIFSLLFLIAQTFNLFYLYETVHYLVIRQEYHFTISALPILNCRIFFVLVPFMYWNKGNRLQDLMNGWLQYQVKFQKLTGLRFITISKQDKIFQKFLGSVSGFIVLCMVLVITSPKILAQEGWNTASLFHHSIVNLAIFMGCWTANTDFMALVGKSFLSSLQKCTESDSETFRNLAILWFDSRRLMNDIYDSNYEMIVIMLSIVMVNCVASLYILFFWFTAPNGFDVEKYLKLTDFSTILIASVMCFVLIYHICESGYAMDKKVLFDAKYYLMNTDFRSVNPEIVYEIWYFLQILEISSSTFSIRNNFKVNRSAFCEVLMYVVNYLVVLQQFTPILLTLSHGTASEINSNNTDTTTTTTTASLCTSVS